MRRLGLTFPFRHQVSLPDSLDLARGMVLDGLAAIGDETFCRARVAEYARAGLTMPMIVPFSPDAAPVPSLLRSLRAFP